MGEKIESLFRFQGSARRR